MLIRDIIVSNVHNLGLLGMNKLLNKIVIFQVKHLWGNTSFKSVSMVTKEKFQNMILSLNLNNNCKSLFFGTHYHGFSIQISKIKIENRCYGNKLKNKVFLKIRLPRDVFMIFH